MTNLIALKKEIMKKYNWTGPQKAAPGKKDWSDFDVHIKQGQLIIGSIYLRNLIFQLDAGVLSSSGKIYGSQRVQSQYPDDPYYEFLAKRVYNLNQPEQARREIFEEIDNYISIVNWKPEPERIQTQPIHQALDIGMRIIEI